MSDRKTKLKLFTKQIDRCLERMEDNELVQILQDDVDDLLELSELNVELNAKEVLDLNNNIREEIKDELNEGYISAGDRRQLLRIQRKTNKIINMFSFVGREKKLTKEQVKRRAEESLKRQQGRHLPPLRCENNELYTGWNYDYRVGQRRWKEFVDGVPFNGWRHGEWWVNGNLAGGNGGGYCIDSNGKWKRYRMGKPFTGEVRKKVYREQDPEDTSLPSFPPVRDEVIEYYENGDFMYKHIIKS